MKFKFIFWDSDGTLVNTEPAYFSASSQVLASHGIELTDEFYEQHILRKGRSVFDLAVQKGIHGESIRSMRAERNELYLEKLKTHVEILPGRVEILKRLYGKIPMAIVTSSRRDHFEEIMKKTALAKFFDFFITANDVENIKPSPEPYLQAWERVELKKSECLVIEDTERGVVAAKKAGLTCFALPNKLSKHNDFSMADRILNSIEDLEDYL